MGRRLYCQGYDSSLLHIPDFFLQIYQQFVNAWKIRNFSVISKFIKQSDIFRLSNYLTEVSGELVNNMALDACN